MEGEDDGWMDDDDDGSGCDVMHGFPESLREVARVRDRDSVGEVPPRSALPVELVSLPVELVALPVELVSERAS